MAGHPSAHGVCRFLALGFTAWCLLSSARVARAERIAILTYPAKDAPERAKDLHAAMAEILSAEEIEVVNSFQEAREGIENGVVEDRALIPFTRAQLLLDEGWRSYLEVRASFAAARLAEARTVALDVAHLDGGLDLLAEVSLRLGAIKLDLQRAGEAADDFRLAHALTPNRRVDDSEFKPEVVDAYQAAIAATLTTQARPIHLDPASARLSIDGVEITATALSSDGIAMTDGLHLVSAVAPGFFSQSQLISVSPRGVAPIEVTLAIDPVTQRVMLGKAGLARGVAESEARQSVSAILLYSASDTLVTLSSVWRRAAPAALGQLCAGRPLNCSKVVEIGYPEGGLRVALDQLWRELRAAPMRFPPTMQIDARVIDGEERPGRSVKGVDQPFWKSRWLWVGLGAATVASGAVYLLRGDSELRPTFLGDRCSFGGC